MSSVIGTISKILFYVFVVLVLIWTASLTVGMVSKVLPGDPVMPYFALCLFDGGAICWLLTFLYYGRGLGQRATSLLLVVLDLIGVVLMAGGEIFMSGQKFAQVPDGLGTVIVYAIGGYTALNLIGAYFFHIADPDNQRRIESQTAQDKIVSKALTLHAESLNDISAVVAGKLSDRSVRDALISLGVNPDGYVDGRFRDAPPAADPARLDPPASASVDRSVTVPLAVPFNPPAADGQPQTPALADTPDALRWPVEYHHTMTPEENPIAGGTEAAPPPFVSVPRNGHRNG